MKKTQFIELLSTIKNTFVSFISILAFVTLSIGLYSGISWAGKAVEKSLKTELDITKFHDLQYIYPYGFDESDVERLKQIKDVDEVELSYFANEYTDINGQSVQFNIYQINEIIDLPLLKEGKLPTEIDEIVINDYVATNYGLKVGDTISFKHNNESLNRSFKQVVEFNKDEDEIEDISFETNEQMDLLKSDTYKITGVVIDPNFLSVDGNTYGISLTNRQAIGGSAYISKSSFDESAFIAYPYLNIRSNSLRGYDIFSDEYQEAVEKLNDELSCEIEKIVDKKNQLITSKIDDFRDYAQEILDDGKVEIDDAKIELNDASIKLKDAKKQIEDGVKQLQDGYDKYYDAADEIKDAEETLNNFKAKYKNVKEDYRKTKDDYNDNVIYANAMISAINDLDDLANTLKEIGIRDLSSLTIDLINKIEDDAIDLINAIVSDLKTEFSSDQDVIDLANKVDPIISQYVNNEITVEEVFDMFAKEDGYGKNIYDYLDDVILKPGRKDDIDTIFKSHMPTFFDIVDDLLEIVDDKILGYDNEIANNKLKLKKAWYALSEADQLLKDSKAEYDENYKKYQDGIKEFEEANQKYLDGIDALDEYNDKTNSFEKAGFVSLLRKQNSAFIGNNTLADVFFKVRYAMAGLFIIVGILVCYSGISRIINDQTTSIGTKKALGFMPKEISLSYLLYTGLAIAIGLISGVALAYLVTEEVLVSSFESNFPITKVFDLNYFYLVAILEVVILILATHFAIKDILKKNAINLLKGNDVVTTKNRFYEKSKIWNKLSLLTKTIINNAFNDTKRVIGTIIGIAGSCALIVTALTYSDNISISFERAFDKYLHFDTIVMYDDTKENADGKISDTLKINSYENTKVLYTRTYTILPNGDYILAHIFVPDDIESFKQIYSIEEYGTDKEASYKGLWMPHSYANSFGEQDTIEAKDLDGNSLNLNVSGYYYHYLANYCFVMDKDYYEENFNTDFVCNAFLINTGKKDVSILKSLLSDNGDVTSIVDFYDNAYTTFGAFKSVAKTMVSVYISLAIAMALLVLLNLLIMFIDEKRRELIVMLINGFSLKDAKRYIYTDTIFLTIIGIICGIALGTVIGNLAVSSCESPYVALVKQIDIKACLVAILGSCVLTTLVSLIALSRIKKFKLTDINKL